MKVKEVEMSSAHVKRFGIAIALILASVPAGAGQTAKFALPEVMAAAKQWQGDAVLVSLSSTKAQ
jgi:hypothetical protein